MKTIQTLNANQRPDQNTFNEQGGGSGTSMATLRRFGLCSFCNLGNDDVFSNYHLQPTDYHPRFD